MSPVMRGAKTSSLSAGRKQKKTGGGSAKKREFKVGRGQKVPGAKKIVNSLLPQFARQLSSMLSAGMPIVACLEALEEQSDNPSFRAIIKQLSNSIENGSALSEALRQFPSVFDSLFCNMVKGGETGGQLAETIARLAGFLEASAKLKRKVKAAMMYPTIVLCIALGIAVAMILFIVPVFAVMYEDFGGQLPAPTQFLVDLSEALRKYGIFFAAGIVALVVTFKKWKASPSGGYTFDSLLLKFPVFGELNQKVASARFARTFGQLIRSGVPILEALTIVSGCFLCRKLHYSI